MRIFRAWPRLNIYFCFAFRLASLDPVSSVINNTISLACVGFSALNFNLSVTKCYILRRRLTFLKQQQFTERRCQQITYKYPLQSSLFRLHLPCTSAPVLKRRFLRNILKFTMTHSLFKFLKKHLCSWKDPHKLVFKQSLRIKTECMGLAVIISISPGLDLIERFPI